MYFKRLGGWFSGMLMSVKYSTSCAVNRKKYISHIKWLYSFSKKINGFVCFKTVHILYLIYILFFWYIIKYTLYIIVYIIQYTIIHIYVYMYKMLIIR